jgi:dATP pyrophosphohydrolase
MMAEKKLIDLYVYRWSEAVPEYLLLKRAKDQKYSGQWRMVAGKVEKGETHWQAALRELDEETGLKPTQFWTIPSVNQFYEHKSDQILSIPAFAAEVSYDAEIELDSEHEQSAWFDIESATRNIYWPEQKRLLRLLDHILISNQILDDWLVLHT